ncbi:MAG: hypothetical protein IPK16_06730 [Anaerolineales bacterium]|nr:hypothetical protein [Anaerolineales bacterium]
MRRISVVAVFMIAMVVLAGCRGPVRGVQEGLPYARITRPVNPVLEQPLVGAPVVGRVFWGMEFPVVAKADSCRYLQVTTRRWGDVWILGAPRFAVLENVSCEDLPDKSIRPTARAPGALLP